MESQGHIGGEKDLIAETLRSYAQNILVVVFGLLPVFFIPSAFVPFEYTKIIFVVFGLLSALVLYSLSALRAGGVHVGVSFTIVSIWALALIALISSLVSGDFRDSFMGDVLTTHTTGFLILLALIMSTWVLIDAGKRSVIRLYMLLAGSTILLVLYHVIRLFFGADTLSFGIFTGTIGTPMGAWNDLALFLGLSVILAIVALDQLPLTKHGRILFGIVTFLSLLMLGVINFFTVWIVLGVTSLAVIVYSLSKDRFEGSTLPLSGSKSVNTTSLFVSLGVFAVSVLFIIGGASLGAMISKYTQISYIEVRPSIQATTDVARSVYEQNAFLGVGPNKFIDAWRMYKDPSINSTVFWNTDFIAANGYVTTFFITTGVFGALAWIIFLLMFIRTGIHMLFVGGDGDRMWYFIGVSSFVSALYIWGMSLIYVPGAVMLMLGALCVGITLTAERALGNHKRALFSLVTNKKTGFIFTLLVIGVIIGSVSGLYSVGKHYAAAYAFNKSGAILQNEGSAAASAEVERAFSLYQSDIYMRRIGELQFARMNVLLGLPTPTDAERIEFERTIVTGINAAEQARDLDPQDPENWALLGSIYSVLMSANIEGVYENAKTALTRSRELNPKNPLTALNLAVLEGRAGNYDAARTYTNEAISLKPDFTDAFYYLSQIDILTGNVEGAIRSTISIITLEPQNPVRYYQLGVLEAARQNPDNAIVAFERAVALDTNYANARYFLALAYDAKGRKDDARRELEKVLELNLGNTEVMRLIDVLKSGGSLSTSAISQDETTIVPEAQTVNAVNGTVSTDVNPNTPLVSPVNTVPEAKDTPTPQSAPTTEADQTE